jgi:hypothetical protein
VKGLDREPDGLELLEGNVLELVEAGPTSPGLCVVVENCPSSEAVGVAVKL